MIQNISKGKGFRGTSNYVLQKEGAERLECGTMVGRDSRELAKEAGAVRELNPRLGKAVFHCSLSLHEAEQLNNELWESIATQYANQMGFENAPWYAVKHEDSGCQHIHIIGLRIDYDGKTIPDSRDYAKGAAVVQEIEREHGLQAGALTPEQAHEMEERPMSKGQSQKALANDEHVPSKPVVQAQIKAALEDGPTVQAFVERLETAGIHVVPNVAKTGRVSGLAFQMDDVYFKGSQLGKSFSWAGLQKQGLKYDFDRDTAFLQELRYGQNAESARKGASKEPERPGAARAGEAVSGINSGAVGADNRAAGAEYVQPDGRSETGNLGNTGRVSTAAEESGPGVERSRGADENKTTRDRRSGQGDAGRREPGGGGSGAHEKEQQGIENEIPSPSLGYSPSPGYSSRDRINDLAAEAYPQRSESASGANDQPRAQATDARSDNGQAVAPSSFPRPAPPRQESRTKGGGRRAAVCARPPAHIQAKEIKWQQQHEALQAPAYRITLMTKERDKKSFVLGKDKGPNKTEKIYSADEVREKIPFLSAKNAQGYNIYITPIDSQHHYNVIDDMDENNLHKLTESGYTPCLIQESSFKNYQAILKTQKHESSKKEQSAANKFVGKINKDYGDPEFSGVVHPFRMSGFANRKEKYKDDKGNYPFTKIHYAKHTLCNKAAEQIQKERDTLKQEIQVRYTKEANKRREKIQNEAKQKPGLYKDVDKDYMRARHKIERLAEEKGWVKDDSVIDFRASLELLDRYNEEEIKGAIINNSPAIEHRHNNIYDYAERTVDKATQKHEEKLQQIKRDRGSEMEM